MGFYHFPASFHCNTVHGKPHTSSYSACLNSLYMFLTFIFYSQNKNINKRLKIHNTLQNTKLATFHHVTSKHFSKQNKNKKPPKHINKLN
jgi:hypothetical protein